ncbi:hypothetical protein TWF281_009797 [Arthrobotrys megalospora]
MQNSMNRLSTIRSPTAPPKTDISCLPLELHAEILNALDHWTHHLIASQVCQAWRELLKRYRDPSLLYQQVYTVAPGPGVQPVPPKLSLKRKPSDEQSKDGAYGRHLLFQECSIAYRRCPVTGQRQMKVNPTKDMGFYDDQALCYFPSGATKPEFYKFSYLSLLSSPIAADGPSSPDKPRSLYFLEFDRMCIKRRIASLQNGREYRTIGSVLDLVLDSYKECFQFSCTDCANKFEAKRERNQLRNEVSRGLLADVGLENWDFGDWEKTGYEEFGRQCNEFGVIIQELEKRRKPGLIVLRVCPGESW